MNASVVAIVIGSLVFLNAGASMPARRPRSPSHRLPPRARPCRRPSFRRSRRSRSTWCPGRRASRPPRRWCRPHRRRRRSFWCRATRRSSSARNTASRRTRRRPARRSATSWPQDAIVDGRVVAKSGDTADGQVEEGQNGESGKAANLRVSVDDVYNFCGDTVHVEFDRTESRKNQGVFGSKKDVRIGKGQRYVAVTDRPQRVCTEATTATPAPIPAEALRTNEQ